MVLVCLGLPCYHTDTVVSCLGNPAFRISSVSNPTLATSEQNFSLVVLMMLAHYPLSEIDVSGVFLQSTLVLNGAFKDIALVPLDPYEL